MIKNILFDLGGVLLNIDYDAPVKQFEQLGLKDFDQLYTKKSQHKLLDDLETGNISPDQFRTELKKHLTSNPTDQQINTAWNSILLDFPTKRMELLKNLKTHYNILVLSNTNAIHIEGFNQILWHTLGIKHLNEVAEHVYFSHEIHQRKPNEAAFEYVLNDAKIEANQTLYIEDSIQHINAAQKMGFQCIHHPTNGDILPYFDTLLSI